MCKRFWKRISVDVHTQWCRESVMRGELLSWMAFDCTRHGDARTPAREERFKEEEVQKERAGGGWRAG